jgi:hypothetical protein
MTGAFSGADAFSGNRLSVPDIAAVDELTNPMGLRNQGGRTLQLDSWPQPRAELPNDAHTSIADPFMGSQAL